MVPQELPQAPESKTYLDLWRKDLAQYCVMMNPEWEPAAHLVYLALRLEAIRDGKLRRLIITMPPQHGKTLTTSKMFPAWYLGHHPNHWVIGASYNETKALDCGLAVQDQLNDRRFQALFPKLRLKDNSNSGLLMRTTAGGAYMATGRNGGQTGFPCNVFIVDDPYKDAAEAGSDAVRREVRSWYNNVIYPRQAPNGAIIVMHTRWLEDDMIGWLLAEHGNENWEVVNLPALAYDSEPDLLGREPGRALWPERYSDAELEKRRRNDPLGFQALYQQRPAGAGARMFKREWLESSAVNCRYDPAANPPNWRRMNRIMIVDPANSKRASADYTSAWVLGLGLDMNYYVLDMVRDRLGLVERGDMVFRLHRKWELARVRSWVVYESYGLQSDTAYLSDRMVRENYRFALTEVGGRLSKADRIGRLVALFQQGRIIMPTRLYQTRVDGEEEDVVRAFIDEEYANYLVGGGGAAHDDMLDALARIFDLDLVWPRANDYGENLSSGKVRSLMEARRHRPAGLTWMGY